LTGVGHTYPNNNQPRPQPSFWEIINRVYRNSLRLKPGGFSVFLFIEPLLVVKAQGIRVVDSRCGRWRLGEFLHDSEGMMCGERR
jgi:hypothetical protein